MKKFFVTGLVILLPLALTVFIITFFVDLLTDPFVDLIQGFFTKYNVFESRWLPLSSIKLQYIISKVIILIFLFFATVGLGILARWVLFNYFVRLWDGILHRIPIVNRVYKGSQDIVKTLFNTNTNSFKQTVLVPFPHKDSYTVGLVTNDAIPNLANSDSSHLVAVFVPTTPNPTSGFVMLFKPQDLIYIDMKTEDALKFIISCGVIQPTNMSHVVITTDGQNIAQEP